jgi:hypothetical protein
MLLVELYKEKRREENDVLYRYRYDDGSNFCILPFSTSYIGNINAFLVSEVTASWYWKKIAAALQQ